MPITLLRWKSGACGDTILKIVLDSNPTLCSQNRYVGMNDGKTEIDINYVKNFQYSEIANMSSNMLKVDEKLLMSQLKELDSSDSKSWLLKTHQYIDFLYPIIDIVIEDELIPFVVKASLTKNSRDNNQVPDYHPLIKKIKDKETLYKFDCFNYAADIIATTNISNKTISLKSVLSGWDTFVSSIQSVGLYISPNSKEYYDLWLKQNRMYYPSEEYISSIKNNNFDFKHPNLSIEEKYSMWALLRNKFKIL